MKADFEKGLKICSSCRKELPLDMFCKSKKSSDGLGYKCKNCQHSFYLKNRKKIIEKVVSYQRNLGKQVYLKANKKYNQSEKGKRCRRRIQINSREYKAKWRRDKYKNNLNFQIRSLLRNRLRSAVVNEYRSIHTINLLGCSVEYFKQYLESKFLPGMNWENRGRGSGKWQIDHIIPCSYFDLTKEENQRICFNYRNLQPLWADENNKKHDNIPNNVIEIVEQLKKDIYDNN